MGLRPPHPYAEVMARYRSSPAVSQICAFTTASPTRMVRVENSTPMVVRLSWLNSLRVKRESRFVFPTPDSPIRTTVEGRRKSHWTAPATSTGCMGVACSLMTPDRLQRLGKDVGEPWVTLLQWDGSPLAQSSSRVQPIVPGRDQVGPRCSAREV